METQARIQTDDTESDSPQGGKQRKQWTKKPQTHSLVPSFLYQPGQRPFADIGVLLLPDRLAQGVLDLTGGQGLEGFQGGRLTATSRGVERFLIPGFVGDALLQ